MMASVLTSEYLDSSNGVWLCFYSVSLDHCEAVLVNGECKPGH